MAFPEITVLIPCHNRQDFLPRALRSLNDQSIDSSKFKVIIIDDGSVKPVKINHNDYNYEIILLTHSKNSGLPSALNTGIQNVNTRYFVRVDSDDYVHRDFLRVMRLKFEVEPNVMAVALDYLKVDETEKVLGVFSCNKDPIGCAIMFRTEIIKVIGAYNEEMLLGEEVEFRSRLEKEYKIHRIALPLYRYVQHDNNISNNKDLYDYYKGKITN